MRLRPRARLVQSALKTPQYIVGVEGLLGEEFGREGRAVVQAGVSEGVGGVVVVREDQQLRVGTCPRRIRASASASAACWGMVWSAEPSCCVRLRIAAASAWLMRRPVRKSKRPRRCHMPSEPTLKVVLRSARWRAYSASAGSRLFACLFGGEVGVHLLGLVGEGVFGDDVGGIGAAQLEELVLCCGGASWAPRGRSPAHDPG